MKKRTDTYVPYPDATLANRLREEGFNVRVMWECKGEGSTAFLTCYLVSGPDRAFGVAIVQTFFTKTGGGWEAWLPASDNVDIDSTVKAVIDRRRTATNCRSDSRETWSDEKMERLLLAVGYAEARSRHTTMVR